MATEVRTFTWCDACLANDIHTEATEDTITVNRMKPRVLAFCERHRKELLEPLTNLLLEEGQVVAPTVRQPKQGKAAAADDEMLPGIARPKPSQTGEYTCPDPDPNCRYTSNRANVAKHVRDYHGKTLAHYETEAGVGIDGRELRFFCTVPGEDGEPCGLGYVAGQALAQHQRFDHGITAADRARSGGKAATTKGKRKVRQA